MARNHNKPRKTDAELCRDAIVELLLEYNCELLSADEWSHVLLRDKDTNEYVGIKE